MNNARVSFKQLALDLKLSGPTVAERVRQLETSKVIKGYCALVDPHSLGLSLTAFVAVTLDRPGDREAFLAKIMKIEEIQECHHVAGDHDFLLKVRCRDTKGLDELVSHELKGLKGIIRTRTTIVMGTVKETPILPCP